MANTSTPMDAYRDIWSSLWTAFRYDLIAKNPTNMAKFKEKFQSIANQFKLNIPIQWETRQILINDVTSASAGNGSTGYVIFKKEDMKKSMYELYAKIMDGQIATPGGIVTELNRAVIGDDVVWLTLASALLYNPSIGTIPMNIRTVLSHICDEDCTKMRIPKLSYSEGEEPYMTPSEGARYMYDVISECQSRTLFDYKGGRLYVTDRTPNIKFDNGESRTINGELHVFNAESNSFGFDPYILGLTGMVVVKWLNGGEILSATAGSISINALARLHDVDLADNFY